jgi:hypothetical protein
MIPLLRHDSHPHKAALVNLGLWCLSCGHWRMVMAITRIIQREGLSRG